MAKAVKKTAPIIKSDIKQPQGGCPAINVACGEEFEGYCHKVSKEDAELYEVKRKLFWKSRGFDYESLNIKL